MIGEGMILGPQWYTPQNMARKYRGVESVRKGADIAECGRLVQGMERWIQS